MRRLHLLIACILFAGAELAPAQGVPPTYLRQRDTVYYGPGATGPRVYLAPDYGDPNRGRLRHNSDRQVAAGGFTRPYPYHLDYYKQRYGGSYEPYAGNLYGPPNVVLAPAYGYGGAFPGYGGVEPHAHIGPGIVCPNCGEPWPAAAVETTP